MYLFYDGALRQMCKAFLQFPERSSKKMFTTFQLPTFMLTLPASFKTPTMAPVLSEAARHKVLKEVGKDACSGQGDHGHLRGVKKMRVSRNKLP